MYFLALSHEPPALFSMMARTKPVARAPRRNPARAYLPRTTPTSTGATMVIIEGASICFSAADVAISTHLPYSGFAVPSIRPFISRHCRRTSSTMSSVVTPTDFIAMAQNRGGIMAPSSRPTMTGALSRLRPGAAVSWPEEEMVTICVAMAKERVSPREFSAAAPMANPLPVAAVVLPRESRASVLSRTSGDKPAWVVMPPALSATGPYASVARVTPRVDSMPTAARATP